jgi:hypothetical protein
MNKINILRDIDYKYTVLDLNQAELWNDYLKLLPIEQQDIYYTPEYYSIYQNLGDGKAQCFVFQHNNNIAVYPYLFNSVNELGYDLAENYFDIQGAYGYNGIITSSYDSDFKIRFHHCFSEYCDSQNIIAGFTRFHPILKNHHFSKEYMEITKNRETVFIDLRQSYDEIWKYQYSSQVRRNIRKAHREGFCAETYNRVPTELLHEFITIYTESMKAKRADGYYLFNINYFKDILNILGENAYLFISRISKKNHLEGTAIMLFFGDYAHYHLGARNRGAKSCAHTFLFDEALKYSKNRGAKFLHFGGGNSSDINDTLFRYKTNFSKRRGIFYTGKKIYNEKIYNAVLTQYEAKYHYNNDISRNIFLRYRYIS